MSIFRSIFHRRMMLVALLGALPRSMCDSLPSNIRISSENTSPVILQSIGVYSIEWAADEEPGQGEAVAYYRMTSETQGSASPPRFLYHRSHNGAWVVTSSLENMRKGKGTIVSTSGSTSPLELSFKYYSAGEWQIDGTFAVVDAPSELKQQSSPSKSEGEGEGIANGGSSSSAVDRLLVRIDANGDGSLATHELHAFVRGSSGAASGGGATLDPSTGSDLSRPGPTGAMTGASALLERMDRDRNQAVGSVEFKSFLTASQRLRALSSVDEVREWARHALQLPAFAVNALHAASVSAYDFADLVDGDDSKAAHGQGAYGGDYGALRDVLSLSPSSSNLTVKLTVKRLVRGMHFALLGVGEPPSTPTGLSSRPLDGCRALEITWDNANVKRKHVTGGAAVENEEEGEVSQFPVHKYRLLRRGSSSSSSSSDASSSSSLLATTAAAVAVAPTGAVHGVLIGSGGEGHGTGDGAVASEINGGGVGSVEGGWVVVDEGADTIAVDLNLEPKRTYMYKLQAWNQIGRSPTFAYLEATPCAESRRVGSSSTAVADDDTAHPPTLLLASSALFSPSSLPTLLSSPPSVFAAVKSLSVRLGSSLLSGELDDAGAKDTPKDTLQDTQATTDASTISPNVGIGMVLVVAVALFVLSSWFWGWWGWRLAFLTLEDNERKKHEAEKATAAATATAAAVEASATVSEECTRGNEVIPSSGVLTTTMATTTMAGLFNGDGGDGGGYDDDDPLPAVDDESTPSLSKELSGCSVPQHPSLDCGEDEGGGNDNHDDDQGGCGVDGGGNESASPSSASPSVYFGASFLDPNAVTNEQSDAVATEVISNDGDDSGHNGQRQHFSNAFQGPASAPSPSPLFPSKNSQSFDSNRVKHGITDRSEKYDDDDGPSQQEDLRQGQRPVKLTRHLSLIKINKTDDTAGGEGTGKGAVAVAAVRACMLKKSVARWSRWELVMKGAAFQRWNKNNTREGGDDDLLLRRAVRAWLERRESSQKSQTLAKWRRQCCGSGGGLVATVASSTTSKIAVEAMVVPVEAARGSAATYSADDVDAHIGYDVPYHFASDDDSSDKKSNSAGVGFFSPSPFNRNPEPLTQPFSIACPWPAPPAHSAPSPVAISSSPASALLVQAPPSPSALTSSSPPILSPVSSPSSLMSSSSVVAAAAAVLPDAKNTETTTTTTTAFDPQHCPDNLEVGERLYASNPVFSDGTRLRGGPAADAKFNGVEVLNDHPVTLLEIREPFGYIQFELAGDGPSVSSEGETQMAGWIRLRNLCRRVRVSGGLTMYPVKAESAAAPSSSLASSCRWLIPASAIHRPLTASSSSSSSSSLPSSSQLPQQHRANSIGNSIGGGTSRTRGVAKTGLTHTNKTVRSSSEGGFALVGSAAGRRSPVVSEGGERGSSTKSGSSSSISSLGLEKLGEGYYGTAYRAEYQGTAVVVKVLKPGVHKGEESNLAAEVGILSDLRHPNTILFMGACLQGPEKFIVTEYMAGGDLATLIRRPGFAVSGHQASPDSSGDLSGSRARRFSSPSLMSSQAAAESADVSRQRCSSFPVVPMLRVLADVCRGMAYLHGRGFNPLIHGDLTSANILLTADPLLASSSASVRSSSAGSGGGVAGYHHAVAKVADFGIARHCHADIANDGGKTNGQQHEQREGEEDLAPGNVLYAAPEVLLTWIAQNKQKQNQKNGRQQVTTPPLVYPVGPSCDVFSFGVVCAEVFSAGAAVDEDLKRRNPTVLVVGGVSAGRDRRTTQRTQLEIVKAVLGDLFPQSSSSSSSSSPSLSTPSSSHETAVAGGGQVAQSTGLRPRVPASCPRLLAKELPSVWSAQPEERPPFLELLGTLEVAIDAALSGADDYDEGDHGDDGFGYIGYSKFGEEDSVFT